MFWLLEVYTTGHDLPAVFGFADETENPRIALDALCARYQKRGGIVAWAKAEPVYE